MSTLRYEPIAAQVSKDASPALLFPAEIMEALRNNDILEETDPEWSPATLELMSHYAAVVEIAHLIVGAPPFERLSRLYDALREEYTPDGERGRRSPVYDSHLVMHVLGGVPQGIAGETPFGVLARLLLGDPARARLQGLAQNLAASHLDLYRVTRASGREGELVPLRGGEPFVLHAAGTFLSEGDRLLGRVVEFGGRYFMVDSPYLLEASEQDWLAYLARVSEQGAAGPETSPSNGARKPKLTSKQEARRKKEQKAKAARNTPSERVARHLRVGASERFWFDYVMDAFAGARRGIVRLAGVPDQPETLPHHPDYTGPELEGLSEAELDAHFGALDDDLEDEGDEDEDDFYDGLQFDDEEDEDELDPVHARLLAIAKADGVFQREERALRDALSALGLPPEIDELERGYVDTHCYLSALTTGGTTALAQLARDTRLDDEDREQVEDLGRGRFAVLRIDHVDIERGFDAQDLLRGEDLSVEDDTITAVLESESILLCWLGIDADGTISLEGDCAIVHPEHADAFTERFAALPDKTAPRLPLDLLALHLFFDETASDEAPSDEH